MPVDLLDLGNLQPCLILYRQQFALRTHDVIPELRQNRRVLALGSNMFLDPVEIRFALREACEKILARHAGITHTNLHDEAFLGADHRDDATQEPDQHVKQLRCQLEFHELVGEVGLRLDRLLVFEAVPLKRGQRALLQAANDPDTCLDLFRVRPGINDLVVVVIIRLGDRCLNLVGRVGIDEADDEVLHARVTDLDRVGNLEKPDNRRRKVRHVIFNLVEAVLDALRNLDLALARQQLDRAHLAHVHTHGIGRAAEFGVDTGQCRFCFLGCVVVIGYGGIRQQDRLGIRRLLVHRNTHVIDHVDDILDLLRIDDVVRQVVIDLCVSQIALFLAAGNQIFKLSGLFAAANHCAFFAQDETTSS